MFLSMFSWPPMPARCCYCVSEAHCTRRRKASRRAGGTRVLHRHRAAIGSQCHVAQETVHAETLRWLSVWRGALREQRRGHGHLGVPLHTLPAGLRLGLLGQRPGVARGVIYTGDTLASYTDTAETGRQLARRFCGRCGSSIASEPEAMPGVTVLKAGTLDDRSTVRPGTHFWCGSRQPWVEVPAGVTQFEKGRA